MIEITELSVVGYAPAEDSMGGVACGIGTCSGIGCGLGCPVSSGSGCGLGCPKPRPQQPSVGNDCTIYVGNHC